MNSKIPSTKIIQDTSVHQILTIIIKEMNMGIKGNQTQATTNKNLNNKQLRIPMAENFVGEENLGISSNQQKGKMDSPIQRRVRKGYCFRLG